MKTIAITVDDSTLACIDRISSQGRKKRRNRSAIVRQAVVELAQRVQQEAEEERERAIYRRHRTQLRRDALALIRKQAKV
jgi:hypothetical protein